MLKKSITLFSSTAVEYFEFSIFLFYSYAIAKNYFNSSSYSIPVLFVLITSLGKFCGGTLIASFIDKIGSIKVYKFTMGLTAICTLFILFLPEYKTIGVLSGILFILIRFIQVAAASAEAASSVILSRENFENKAYASSLASAAFIFGFGIANFVSNVVALEYFKYVIITSSIILFSFRYYLLTSGLRDRFAMNDKEISSFKFVHVFEVLKVAAIMTPSCMIQFNLFNFNTKNNIFNMLLMSTYCFIAIVFSFYNRKYLQNLLFGYFTLFSLILSVVVFGLSQDIYKMLVIIPYAMFLSANFAVILDNIDKKKFGLILTMGAAIANTFTVYLLQNVGDYYTHWTCFFALIGLIVVMLLVLNSKKHTTTPNILQPR